MIFAINHAAAEGGEDQFFEFLFRPVRFWKRVRVFGIVEFVILDSLILPACELCPEFFGLVAGEDTGGIPGIVQVLCRDMAEEELVVGHAPMPSGSAECGRSANSVVPAPQG